MFILPPVGVGYRPQGRGREHGVLSSLLPCFLLALRILVSSMHCFFPQPSVSPLLSAWLFPCTCLLPCNSSNTLCLVLVLLFLIRCPPYRSLILLFIICLFPCTCHLPCITHFITFCWALPPTLSILPHQCTCLLT